MPRFKSAGFVNVDVDVNDDEDVTVKLTPRAAPNQLSGWEGTVN